MSLIVKNLTFLSKSLLKRQFRTAILLKESQKIEENDDDRETHFGFETVKESEKAQKGTCSASVYYYN